MANVNDTPIPWSSFVAVGDSVTEGLMDSRPDGSYAGWADRVATFLRQRQPETPFLYANLAIRGRMLPAILDEQIPVALDMKPDLVSLWGGGNDILRPNSNPDDLAQDIEDAVVALRAVGADVLLGLGVDTSGSPVLEMTRGKAAAFSANLWSVARRTGAHILDVWGMRCLKHPGMWAPDRIHFSSEGHRRVAQAAIVGLGLQPMDPHWEQPLPSLPPTSRTARLRDDSHWAREHMLPWVGRRIRKTSSGAGRKPKQPCLQEVPLTGFVSDKDGAPPR